MPIIERAKAQREETHLQWTNRWSTDSSSWKHITHLLAKLTFLLLSIVSVGTLPWDAAHTRKHAFVGAFDFHIALSGTCSLLVLVSAYRLRVLHLLCPSMFRTLMIVKLVLCSLRVGRATHHIISLWELACSFGYGGILLFQVTCCFIFSNLCF